MKSPCVILGLVAWAAVASSAEFAWQQPQAEITATGDIRWSPQAYHFEAGPEIRYIDFDNGDDSQSGTAPDQAWKHHPWDIQAGGNAAAASGVITYVFKGGVVYRGMLNADESGTAEEPIRLARDPDWGDGPATISGSKRLPATWVPAASVAHPERIPDIGRVWALDLAACQVLNKDGNPINSNTSASWSKDASADLPWLGLFRRDAEGGSHVQHLARTPDWQEGNENFPLDYWHTMDERVEKAHPDNPKRSVRTGFADEWLKGHPDDWFVGGYLWPQYALFMGGPTPRLIEAEMKSRGATFNPYDSENGVLYPDKFGSWGTGLRYMIDNLPQYLDAPEEFYFDHDTGHLFYIPPQGEDPNTMTLDWSYFDGGVMIDSQSHIEISGLDFEHQHGFGVQIHNDVADVLVRNCRFEDMLQYGVIQQFKNWRSDQDKESGTITPRYADAIRVQDCDFRDIWQTAVHMSAEQAYDRVLGHVDLLRCRIVNNGIRHKDNIQTPLPAVEIKFPQTAHIAGNVVEDSWGSGLMIFAGVNSGDTYDMPLSRVLVHANKTIDTALAVNDYGGMSLWQGGSIYCYNNNIGNSPGVMPAGILMGGRGRGKATNLSYPLYLDGAYKVFSFNNIIWARSNDPAQDEYATKTPGYFMVFGFLNQLTNNTLYRTGKGVGGSAGMRNDVISNLLAEVGDSSRLGGPNPDAFIAHDRAGDPSLVGGGDDGSSGRAGVPTLAYAHNVFHGEAVAGQLLRTNPEGGYDVGIEGKTVEELAASMQAFPIRYAHLGVETEERPIPGKPSPEPIGSLNEVDFRPVEGSAAIDQGATYFVPWSLYATVGEWHFTENHADPDRSLDFAWYQSHAHAVRNMYPYIPGFDLRFDQATLEDYTEGPLEDWCRGAMTFDGKGHARVVHDSMYTDIVVPTHHLHRSGEVRPYKVLPSGEHWIEPEPINDNKKRPEYAQDAQFVFPGELRNTLTSTTGNLLVEAVLRSDQAGGGILEKYDGQSGYRFYMDGNGHAVFQIASGGAHAEVSSKQVIADDTWHHILAEVDRATGQMRIYVDGRLSAESQAGLKAEASLATTADFIVGKTSDGAFFTGAMDFMRVCHGTLADAKTTIEELYAWQTDGPFKYDMRGQAPVGRRDAGALEYTTN